MTDLSSQFAHRLHLALLAATFAKRRTDPVEFADIIRHRAPVRSIAHYDTAFYMIAGGPTSEVESGVGPRSSHHQIPERRSPAVMRIKVWNVETGEAASHDPELYSAGHVHSVPARRTIWISCGGDKSVKMH